MSPERGGPFAWVLNLDAEEELETGRGYEPADRMRAIVRERSQSLLGTLVNSDDVVLWGDEDVCGLRGLAWCPTPSALARLETAGALALPAPDFDVLRAVHARSFVVPLREELGFDELPKTVVRTLEQALEQVARPSEAGWLVRRVYGAAGRNRRRIDSGVPSEEERSWLAGGLRSGPLVLEPWVEVLRELSRCGFVRSDGTVVLGRPCVQRTDARGAWIETRLPRTGEVSREDDEATARTVQAAGEALVGTGYFGPFGIDGFHYRHCGRKGSNPLGELNPRYTMGWTTSFGIRPLPE